MCNNCDYVWNTSLEFLRLTTPLMEFREMLHPPFCVFVLKVIRRGCEYLDYTALEVRMTDYKKFGTKGSLQYRGIILPRINGFLNFVHLPEFKITNFMWGEGGPPLWSSGQISWLQIRRLGLDSRHYQKKKVVGLERGPLSLVSTTEELLDRKVAAPV
jgi:hypothetical protein